MMRMRFSGAAPPGPVSADNGSVAGGAPSAAAVGEGIPAPRPPAAPAPPAAPGRPVVTPAPPPAPPRPAVEPWPPNPVVPPPGERPPQIVSCSEPGAVAHGWQGYREPVRG